MDQITKNLSNNINLIKEALSSSKIVNSVDHRVVDRVVDRVVVLVDLAVVQDGVRRPQKRQQLLQNAQQLQEKQ